jgi:hypothetical protein
MELVPGEDLAARLARGPVPVDEALPIARRVAEALEAAHEKGIVHRDLKPANVKLDGEARVKVLDFGIAKAVAGEGTAAPSTSTRTVMPTVTHSGTAAGMIRGRGARSGRRTAARWGSRRGGSWGPDGTILFAPSFDGPIFRVPAAGGDPKPVTTIDCSRREGTHRYPVFLPDGKHFLFQARGYLAYALGQDAVYVGVLDDPAFRVKLIEAATAAADAAGGSTSCATKRPSRSASTFSACGWKGSRWSWRRTCASTRASPPAPSR